MESKKQNYKKYTNQRGYLNKLVSLGLIIGIIFAGISFVYVSDLFGFRGSIDYKVEDSEAIKVNIPRGATTPIIANVLKEEQIIRFPLLFKVISKFNGYDGFYKSGMHKLSKKMTYEQIIKALTKNPEVVVLTIPEGFNIRQVAELFIQKNLASKEEIEKLLKKSYPQNILKKIPNRENRLEGYIFPDTYYFGLSDSKESMINKILDNCQQKITKDMEKRAIELKFTMDQIIIMASIVEREAKVSDERKKIAGVFYNRLRNSDQNLKKLQSCATIQYILYMKEGAIKENLRDKDLKIESKYNTYIYRGLPPGPICSPGIDAIEAALYPSTHDYLYFVSKGDGTHAFSKTLSEHRAATLKYAQN